MFSIAKLWRSLRLRLTLTILIILLVGIWGVVTYVSAALRQDLQRVLGEQQLALVTAMADNIDKDVRVRIQALEALARDLAPALKLAPAAVQAELMHRPGYQALFNRGVFVLSQDGRAMADNPHAPGRVGRNYGDELDVARVLEEGTPVVGRLRLGSAVNVPVIPLAVPVLDQKGRVVGAIIGLTDLGAPNFLDQISSTAYGKTGGFLLVAPQQRLVITATDKSRSMGALPPPGENPAMDAMLGGREGTDIWRRPNGVEVLTSAKTIPSSGWMVAVTLPTEEAFAPISQFQRGVLGTALALSLFAVLLVWLLLKRQLEPLAMAAAELRLRAGTQARYYPLEVVREDEIGDLVGGFNRLLADLQESDYNQQDTAAALAIAAALQERTGEIAQVGGWQVDLHTMELNWTRETFRIAEVQGTKEPALAEGINLFAPQARPTITAAIQAAVDHGTPYDLELPIIGALGTHKWVRTQGFAVMAGSKAIRLHGTFQDITQRKQAEILMAAALAEKTALLNEVHHRVKNNLQVITSLMRLEAARADQSGSDVKTVLGGMQARIRSMALLHESLYRSGTFAAVDLGAYLRQLSQQAFRSMAPNGASVGLELELAPVLVSLDKATPVGLLVNELLSNCFKHAFPLGRSGTVRVTLQESVDGQCRLAVSDNGVGLPENFVQKREKSLGLTLVSDLAGQLGSVLKTEPGPGCSFALVFECKSEATQ